MRRIVDLTLPIQPSMRGVEIRAARTLEANGWNAKQLELYSHSGTHMDAPRHFLPDGSTIDRTPLAACIGPARVIDLRPVEPKQEITVEHLGSSAEAIGRGDRVLFCTDWYLRHGTPEYRDALPRIGSSLATWLVQRQVALVGVEPPSVADVNDREELTSIHRTLLTAGIVIVEGLAHLSEIRTPQVELIALPLKVADGDGAPARVVAIEEA
jgi:kynurenine formamidase